MFYKFKNIIVSNLISKNNSLFYVNNCVFKNNFESEILIDIENYDSLHLEDVTFTDNNNISNFNSNKILLSIKYVA